MANCLHPLRNAGFPFSINDLNKIEVEAVELMAIRCLPLSANWKNIKYLWFNS